MRYLPILPLAIFAIGCGDSTKVANYASLGLVEVTGKVTVDGNPAAGMTVIFENPEDRTFSAGATDDYGNYRLKFNSEKSGCTPGQKIVRVSTKPANDDDPDLPPPSGIAIPDRYNRNSQLTASVDDSNANFNFDLTSR